MKEIKFTVPGVPVGKGRPRVTSHGTYTPKKTRDYEKLVQLCWKTQSGVVLPSGVPLMARVEAYFPIPKSLSKRKQEAMVGRFYIHKPDSDNIAKAILDSLNGIAYRDDSAVQLDRVPKRYTNAAPRVEVTIWEAEDDAGV